MLLLAGCGKGGSTTEAGPSGGDVDWPHWGNTADNTHFADLDQIDTGNVAKLQLAWSRPEGAGQFAWETFPIVVGRTMFYDTGTDEVFAVDGATGKVRWTYTPQINFLAGPQLETSEPVSRGVTYGAGRIYLTTADDKLIALDAHSGKKIWQTQVVDPAEGNTLNSPATYWKGELILGGPAGDAGLRGFVAGYDAKTGKRLWRTYVVPPPGKGWNRARGTHGGGDVWMPPVVDPKSGLAYFSTGNPTPGFTNQQRPGCNPFADATVAVDAKTGKIEWTHTEVCNDSWDYDTVQAPTIMRMEDGSVTGTGGGQYPVTKTVIGAASKSGYYSTLDAGTGKLLARSPYLTRYSRPHRVPTVKGTVVCPGIYGGLEYGPASFNPDSASLFVAGNNFCMRYKVATQVHIEEHAPGEDDLEGTAEQVGPATGVIAALDPASGDVKWRTKLPRPSNGGTLATAGGLVLVGDDDGFLYALDQSDGKIVWKHDLKRRVGSAPISYEIDGVQYIAIAAGGALVEAHGTAPDRPARLFVFQLPG
ncbi:MAG TPA: PQQ-binding-like beta-propeller repeat protein [Solirubrobacterales bacterium]|nr:PQQ-binding-like beta-propeller repeat protein [Solirubrobacterales bacterium]